MKVIKLTLVGSLISSISSPIWGQEEKTVVNSPSKVEKFEVTGSHIKRIQIEGPSPVSVISSEDLSKSGAVSVADVLRETTGSSFGGLKEHSGSNAAGVANVNLRGLGSSRTLVLLNGKRLPQDAITSAPDLNLIPLAAVERIEILKDGASATYGSDALGGVVNIILKKDFDGLEASYKRFFPSQKGGGKEEFSAIAGSSSAKTSFTTVFHYRKNDSVQARDREWSKDGVSTSGSPGSYRGLATDDDTVSSTTWKADPNCAQESIKTVGSNQYCTFKHGDYASIYPDLDQLSSMTSIDHALPGRHKLHLRVNANKKRASWSYAPAPDSFTIPSATAKTLGPNGGPLPGVSADQDVQVLYRLNELGNRVSKIETTAFGAVAGVTGDISPTWDYDASYSQARIRTMDIGVSGYAVRSLLSDAIETGAFNPFAAPGARGQLDSVKYEPWELSSSQVKQGELRFAGELFDLPAGPISLAIGAGSTEEQFSDRSDNLSVEGLAFGSAGSNGGGKRQTKYAFMELAIPLAETLELQLAGRHDSYSDFGSSTNPKVAVRYAPTNQWMFRASAGTGFKAPQLTDLYAAESYGYPTFVDTKACEQAVKDGDNESAFCEPSQYLVKSSGNKNLKEEKSTSYNIGSVFQVSDHLALGLDYWTIKLNNVVAVDYQSLMNADAAGNDLSKYGVAVHRDASGEIDRELGVEAPTQNLAARQVSGLDFNLDMKLPSRSLGTFFVGDEFSWLFWYKEEGFPGTGLNNTLDSRGQPRWRNSLKTGYSLGANEFTLTTRTIAGQKKSDPSQGRLMHHSEHDVQYQWTHSSGSKIVLGAINVTARKPPLDDSNPSQALDESLYDEIGRVFYAGVTQTF